MDVTAFLDQGIASLRQHQTYLAHLSHDFNAETFLRQNAAEAGKRYGHQYAVDFEVVVI